jgi:hypothetical protein
MFHKMFVQYVPLILLLSLPLLYVCVVLLTREYRLHKVIPEDEEARTTQ